MDIAVTQVFNALSVSSILLLVALGLAFTFGLMGVINMAHGEFIMLGAYTAYLLERWLGPAGGLPFALALPAAFALTAALGFLLEAVLVRHLYARPLDTLLATWGVSLILQQVARDLFGAPNVQVTSPPWLEGGVPLLGAVLPNKRLFIVALAGACLAGIYGFLYRTAAGRRVRAVMQNRAVASALGVDARRVDGATFALGSGLAGVAGCALTLLGPIGPALGTYYIVDAFLVVILGGVGQLGGTLAAAGVVGTFNTLFEFGSTASLGKVLVFGLVILFLQWRPAGLLALRTRALD